MHALFPHLAKFRNPVYLVALVVLVGVLASVFPNLGTDGITYAVIGAVAILIAVPIGFGMLKTAWHNMIYGKPGKLDFMTAPAGYRRARMEETEEEAAAQSVVSPTPNRPLVVDADPGQAVVRATTGTVARTDQGSTLDLADGCTPPLHLVLGRAITFLGQRGSGKTNGLARFLERVCRFPIPALICDHEEDYDTLPQVLGERCLVAGSPEWEGQHRYKKYWKVSCKNAELTGYAILEYGVQLVLQTSTYELDEAAQIMTAMIKGMFKWAEEQDPKTRVPALVVLDEAQFFLPQNSQVSSIKDEYANALLNAFAQVNARGRRRGLTPIIATQRPAQVRKEAITGSEIYFLGRQTYPIDLKFYEDLVGKELLASEKITRTTIANFTKGDFLVFEGGECYPIHFKERESEHKGNTPGLEQAMRRYGGKSSTITSQTLDWLDNDEEDVDTEELEDDLSLSDERQTPTTFHARNETVKLSEYENESDVKEPLERDETFTGFNERDETFTVSHEDEIAVLKAAMQLQSEGKTVTREAIKQQLGWNNAKHSAVKSVCDKHKIAVR